MAKKTSKSVLCRRYAQALLDQATEAKTLKNVDSDMAALAATINQSDELATVLANPIVPADQLLSVITDILNALKSCKTTKEFCALLSNNQRLGLLTDIAASYKALAAESRGEISAHVTSAASLNTKDEKAITAALQKATGSAVNLETREDSSLLGGLIVTVGSVQMDASLRGKLERIKIQLQQTDL